MPPIQRSRLKRFDLLLGSSVLAFMLLAAAIGSHRELYQLDAVKTNCGRNRMLTICQYV